MLSCCSATEGPSKDSPMAQQHMWAHDNSMPMLSFCPSMDNAETSGIIR